MNLDEFLKFWKDLKAAYEEKYNVEFSSAEDILAEYGYRKTIPNYRVNNNMLVLLQNMNVPNDVADRVNELIYDKKLQYFVDGEEHLSIVAMDDVLDGIYNEWDDRILKNEGEEARRNYSKRSSKRRDDVRVEKQKIKQAEERQKAQEEQNKIESD